MESENSQDLDNAFAGLRSALKRIHAPRDIRDDVTAQHKEKNVALPGPSKWWVPLGLAASLGIVAFGIGMLSSHTEPKVTDSAIQPTAGFLITRAQIPLRVNSLSRGAELRYLDSHMVRSEFGFTRVVYVQLSEKD